MNVIKSVAGDNRCEYKCFDVLRSVILDENVNRIIGEGIVNGEITGFDDELWQKIHNQNIRGINNFEDVFRDGANIGYCTVASKQVSYSFNSCYICGGILPLLIGTRNCTDGSHTWIECDGKL